MSTSVTWQCEECKIKLEPQKMLQHLEEVHKIQKGKVVTTKKRPKLFADSPGYSMQSYQWVIEGLELTQTIEITGETGNSFMDLDVIPS